MLVAAEDGKTADGPNGPSGPHAPRRLMVGAGGGARHVPTLMTTAILVGISAIGMAAAAPAGTSDTGSTTVDAPADHIARASVTDVVTLRPLHASNDLRIVDDLDRDTVLRGANLNSLGEYWQGVPNVPATIAVTDDDWASMAANGMSVVRLIITWSKIEPQPGQIDQTYLDAVDAQVVAAARHGIYSVIDMHQDAWSPFIATTDPGSCPTGTVPGKGWDGAPAWATITDGASTCTPTGDRYAAPAVLAAFNNFYVNRNGIQDRFVATWAAVATRFAGRPEVAGYDLLNEPAVPRPAAEIAPLYNALIRDLVNAVRSAESVAGSTFRHLIFVEPALPAGDITNGIVIPDPTSVGLTPIDIVGAPHNYAESIGIPGVASTVEQLNELYLGVTRNLGVPLWIGEYGYWDTSPQTMEKVRRHAADDDRLAIGGAWWQWRQSCGDPHAVFWDNGQVVAPDGESTHLNRLGCPGNTDLGPNEAFLEVLGRAYPRSTPGRITTLRSDPESGVFLLAASTPVAGVAGGDVVIWVPDQGAEPGPTPTVENLVDVHETAVPGGRILRGIVAQPGCYAVHLSDTTTACPTANNTPAVPIVTPTFTG